MTTDLMGDVRWCAADDFYVVRCVESDCASGFLTEFITAGSNCHLLYGPQHYRNVSGLSKHSFKHLLASPVD